MNCGKIGNKLIETIFRKREGLAQIPLLVGLMIMAVAIPVATKLVQQNQESRSSAAGGLGDGKSCYQNTQCQSNYCTASKNINTIMVGICEPGIPTVDTRVDIKDYYVEDIVKIKMSCDKCHHTALFVDGQWKKTENGNSVTYGYQVTESKSYEFTVKGCSIDSSTPEYGNTCPDKNLSRPSTRFVTVKPKQSVSTGSGSVTRKKYIVYTKGSCHESVNSYKSLTECNNDQRGGSNNCYETLSVCKEANIVPGINIDTSKSYEVGDEIRVSTDCGNCHHTALMVNDSWVKTENGHPATYIYKPDKAGQYKFQIRACGVDSSDLGDQCPSESLGESSNITVNVSKETTTCSQCSKRVNCQWVEFESTTGGCTLVEELTSFNSNKAKYTNNKDKCPLSIEAADFSACNDSTATNNESGSGTQPQNPGTGATQPQNNTCQKCANGKDRTKGDANCDGNVDGADFSIYRREALDKVMTVGTLWAADFDCKNDVTEDDLKIWKANKN